MIATQDHALVPQSRWELPSRWTLEPDAISPGFVDVGTTVEWTPYPSLRCTQLLPTRWPEDFYEQPFKEVTTRIGRLAPSTAFGDLRGLIDLGLVSFDITTIGGQPDPAWVIAPELSDTLAEVQALAQQLESLVSRMEAIDAEREERETTDESDVIVFGSPNRVVRVKGRKVGSRRGEPLVIAEDCKD